MIIHRYCEKTTFELAALKLPTKGKNVEEHHLQYDPILAINVAEKAAGILVPKNDSIIHELSGTGHTIIVSNRDKKNDDKATGTIIREVPKQQKEAVGESQKRQKETEI